MRINKDALSMTWWRNGIYFILQRKRQRKLKENSFSRITH